MTSLPAAFAALTLSRIEAIEEPRPSGALSRQLKGSAQQELARRMTALLGGPVFLVLLLREKRERDVA